jgi:hypothetical protein
MGRALLILATGFLLSGCSSGSAADLEGTALASPDPQPASGIHLDKSYTDLLEREFNRTVECTSLAGNFWEVAVFLYPPPQFECTGGNNAGKLCYGEFMEPNKILLARTTSWRHEVIHYLLYKNTGDLDPDHHSPLFIKCSESA